MTEYTITIDGYDSRLTKEGVEEMVRRGLADWSEMDVRVEESE